MFISACLFYSLTHLLVLTNVFSLHIEHFKNSDSHKPALLLSYCHSCRELLGFLHLLQIAALLIQSCNISPLKILLLLALIGCLLLLTIPNWNDLFLVNKMFLSSFKMRQFVLIFSNDLLAFAGD